MLLLEALVSNDGLNFLGQLFVGLGTIIAALLGLIAALLARRAHHAKAARTAAEEAVTVTSVIREQVANSHETNLRDDIDALAAALLELGKKQDRQHQVVTDELRQARIEMTQVREDQSEDRKHMNSALATLTRLVRSAQE